MQSGMNTGLRSGNFGGPGAKKQKPSIHDPNTLKNKDYKVLNMRHPAGGIIDLQTQDRRGNLQKAEVGFKELKWNLDRRR